MKIDPSFYDDSSGAMKLNHRASVESVEDTIEDREAADERYQNLMAPLRDVEVEKLRAAGVTDIEAVVPTNAGAHKPFERRKRQLMREGYSQADSERIALQEQPNVLHPPEPEKFDPETAPDPKTFTESQILALMHREVKLGGGGSNGRRRKKDRPLTGEERIARRMMTGGAYDEGHSMGNRIGRPWDGVEKREVVPVRAEPRDVRVLKAHGTSPAEAIEIMADCIRMAQNNKTRAEIMAYFMDIVATDEPDELSA